MSEYEATVETGAGSNTLPLASLYAAADAGAVLREVHIANNGTTGYVAVLRRLTTAGTPGTGLTEAKRNPNSPPAHCTTHATHSVGPTLGDELRRWPIPGAYGAGIPWVFGGGGLIVPLGVTNGVGIVTPSGAGQVSTVTFVWEE